MPAKRPMGDAGFHQIVDALRALRRGGASPDVAGGPGQAGSQVNMCEPGLLWQLDASAVLETPKKDHRCQTLRWHLRQGSLETIAVSLLLVLNPLMLRCSRPRVALHRRQHPEPAGPGAVAGVAAPSASPGKGYSSLTRPAPTTFLRGARA